MPVQPGQMLSHYRLIEKIGEGGMGVVWKAVDTTLDRDVAIKVLPDAFAKDRERLARFQREAKLLASLNHANIATVHSVHETDGVRFLAMEFVDGEDLAQRLARGAIPVEEALQIAVQMAEALEAAHDTGVIHRDLKPANIRLTRDGKVKVLDFGLAKTLSPDAVARSADGSPSISPTVTSAGTVAGVILGTAAYMSPEQARGEPVDKRADVWAFGCVLFEMLTGRTTFKANTVSDTLASVLKVEPDWSLLPADVPHNLRRLLIRCVRKDAQQRLHDIADARIEIEETLATPPEKRSVAPTTSARPRVPIGITVVVAVAALAVGLLAGLQFAPSTREQTARRFFLPVVAEKEPATLSAPALSRDGRKVVYRFNYQLWVHDLEQGISRSLVGTEGGAMPFWSPDSAHVGYRKDGSYWRIPVSGGQPALISEESSEAFPASWGDNGMISFSMLDYIRMVPARGGEPETILEKNPETEQHFHGAYQLPGGRALLLVRHRDEGLDTITLWTDGERRDLLTLGESHLGNPTYSPTGHILFTRRLAEGGLWAFPFSLASLERTGEPFLVAPEGTDASTSEDGTLIYRDVASRSDLELVWFDADGTILGTIGEPQADMEFPTLSPDGTRVAVSGQEDNDWDIWVHDETGRKLRITFDKGRENMPRWSSDGSRVLYHYPEDNPDVSIYSVDPDAGKDRKLLTRGRQVAPARNDSSILFGRNGNETEGDIWWSSLDGDDDAEAFLQNAVDEFGPVPSPDGRFLAYIEGKSSDPRVYVRPFPEGSEKWQVSFEHGWRAFWSPAGDRLYYHYYHKLMEVQVSTNPVLRLGTPRLLFEPDQSTLQLWRGVDIAEDGKRFVGIRGVEKDDESEVEEGIHVVLNWFSDFAD